MIIAIDVVLWLGALGVLVWLATELRDNRIRPQDSWADWALVSVVAVALIGKLIKWCTPWL